MIKLNRNEFVFTAIAILCLIGYSNSFHVPFHFDDLRLIRFNFSLRDLTDLRMIVLSEPFRPLLVSTFALNFEIGKHDPFGYHVVNLIFHFGAVCLFYLLLKRQSAASSLPAVAALLMAVHPLNTESVTYISSRSIVLCSVFYLFGVLCFDSYARNMRRRTAFFFFLTFLCGTLVKEEAVLVAPAVLLYDLFFFGWDSVKKRRAFHLVTHSLLVAAALIRIFFHFKYQEAFPHPMSTWIPTEISVWLRYLWLAVYPVKLNIDHDIRSITATNFTFWVSLLVVLGLLASAWKVRKTHPFLSFWTFWFFLNLAASSLVPLNDLMAEHRAYLSLFGFCAILSHFIVIPWGTVKRSPAFVAACVVVLIGFYTISTYQRNRVWSNELTLWYDSAQKSPEKPRPHINLAGAYAQRKVHDLAIQEYLYALMLDPAQPYAYSGLGICYLSKRNLDKAGENFNKAMKLQPDLPDAMVGMGMVLFYKAEYDPALRYFESVYPRRKESIPVVSLMSEAYLRTKRYDQAVDFMRRGIALAPSEKKWYPRLMEAYFRAGKTKEAADVYDSYHQHFPTDRRTLLRTAEMLTALGRQQDAQKLLDNKRAR